LAQVFARAINSLPSLGTLLLTDAVLPAAMAGLRVVAAALAVLAARAQDCVEPMCSYMPCDTGKKVGSCRFFGCSAKHGATDCVKGECLCAEGTCAGDDGTTCVEQPTCQKLVGSCLVFGCDKKHGATDCVDGKCLCAEGSCSADGITCLAVGARANTTQLSEADVKELSSDASIARLEAKVERLSAQLRARGEGGAGSAGVALLGAIALVSPIAAASVAWAVRRGRWSPSREALLAQ